MHARDCWHERDARASGGFSNMFLSTAASIFSSLTPEPREVKNVSNASFVGANTVNCPEPSSTSNKLVRSNALTNIENLHCLMQYLQWFVMMIILLLQN